MKKFNIILEDGGVYQNCVILTSRGSARNKRDVFVALKYEKCITICNKFNFNKRIYNFNIYEVEEILNTAIPPKEDVDESE